MNEDQVEGEAPAGDVRAVGRGRRLGRGLRGVGRGLGRAGGFAARATEPDPRALRRHMRVDAQWRELDEEGFARRLSPTETIAVTRTGRWRTRDPLTVQTGWHESGRALGLGVWAAAVAIAWWAGRRGHGPLGLLESRDRPW